MITAIIIGHNEGEFVQKMHESLSAYPNMQRIWIADRCSDGTEDKLKELGEMYICTSKNLEGRQTSYCRNLGYRLSDPTSDLLFLDGDRYLVTGDLESLESSTEDINLLLLENDFRTQMSNIFWQRHNYGHVNNFFYSCGLFMKRHAANLLAYHQQGQIFREEAQSEWGAEDLLLGDMCYHLHLTAKINKSITLHGSFSNMSYDSFKPMELRFQYRDKLSVIW